MLAWVLGESSCLPLEDQGMFITTEPALQPRVSYALASIACTTALHIYDANIRNTCYCLKIVSVTVR